MITSTIDYFVKIKPCYVSRRLGSTEGEDHNSGSGQNEYNMLSTIANS